MRTDLLAALLFLAVAPLAQADTPPAEPDYPARMGQAHAQDTPSPSPAALRPAASPVSATDVTYGEDAGQPLRGYLAFPVGDRGARPGVLVFHEWWGLNDNIRSMTRQLAEAGYAALALDLYGEVAQTPDAAQALMKRAVENPGALGVKIEQAHAYLARNLRAPRVGTIGWCFGGAMSYEAGVKLGDRVDAVVIYYGRVGSDPKELKKLTAPVLGIFGALDTHITPAMAKGFEQGLKALGREVEVKIYDGAGHGFANPSGKNYEAAAASDAWRRTLAFLARHLKP